jgi:hypothetical protein
MRIDGVPTFPFEIFQQRGLLKSFTMQDPVFPNKGITSNGKCIWVMDTERILGVNFNATAISREKRWEMN